MNKSTQLTMFSSKTGQWATPQEFFNKLDWRYGPFDLDPCADSTNTKCANFFTEAEDGLGKSATVVMLIPARTDTKYWHDYIMDAANKIHFIKGRLKFVNGTDPTRNSAPFPSAVVVFDGSNQRQIFGAMNR